MCLTYYSRKDFACLLEKYLTVFHEKRGKSKAKFEKDYTEIKKVIASKQLAYCTDHFATKILATLFKLRTLETFYTSNTN